MSTIWSGQCLLTRLYKCLRHAHAPNFGSLIEREKQVVGVGGCVRTHSIDTSNSQSHAGKTGPLLGKATNQRALLLLGCVPRAGIDW